MPTFELIQRVWSARALGARGQPDQQFPWFAFCCWFPFALTNKFQAKDGSMSSRLGVGLHGLCLRILEGLGFAIQRLVRGGQKSAGKKAYPWGYKDKIERMATSLMMCVWLFKACTYVLVHRTGLSTLDMLQSRVKYSLLLVLATELFSRCFLCQFVHPPHELRSSCCCCCCRHRTRKRSLGQQGSQEEGAPPAKRQRTEVPVDAPAAAS
jgi:hypothetical protein